MRARMPGRLPPLNALRAFEVSARHLNFRAAAGEIGVTQGAVAQQVRHLEDTLGVRLFERLPRGLALTADGLAYFADVRRALNLIGDATDRLAKRRSSVTISTTPSFASRWLIPRLASFGDEHPDVDIRVIADSQFATFQGDGVDLAIRYGKPPFGKGLVARLLFPVDIHAVCSPALLAPSGARARDLAGQVLLHDAHDLWPEFLAALPERAAVDPAKGPRFNQSSLAIDAAIAGHGVALASDQLVARDIEAGRLRRLFDFALPLSIGYYIVYPNEPRRPDDIAKTEAWLIREARRDGA
ncbi:LysR substrate-binding domain-containing protein [Burkholderia thailandensis]|uniref:Transcriptional regulator, LysR family n=1 Tax=Burkholderia thailandensis (strain ATCC 700388 / DSM 13276 / CCUG 48851 / CIP 106301 / E264) TaxID=271848 RepID=Q2T8Q1_BURTA|nr:LysR substrate-binding domain-containing protein [Burkholderia thailandensis]ABC34327.1 transcriptional regulator, LysR family [Burkholderia thailandensis E264]AVR07102.1 LysR family transcriptional regulator [Burkholderia thailandensis]MCS3396574.1 LysR substrate-binding domain-containing protein [Burkholderia thailandensis]MCS6499377.1 LysR substrate-binding domain-containing protein [Burkholderia thailandensis]MUV29635.1 LysR family transcriptional regulator [Burkholderia thailandensis]